MCILNGPLCPCPFLNLSEIMYLSKEGEKALKLCIRELSAVEASDAVFRIESYRISFLRFWGPSFFVNKIIAITTLSSNI